MNYSKAYTDLILKYKPFKYNLFYNELFESLYRFNFKI